MEDIPLPDESVDVVIADGVINLSFRKRRVIEEMFGDCASFLRTNLASAMHRQPLNSYPRPISST